MKIFYVHQHFATPQMPGITRTYEMARRLAEAGHEVHVLTTDQRPNSKTVGWYETQTAGIRVHWLPATYRNHMGVFRRLIAFSYFAAALPARIRALGKPDLIYASSPPLTLTFPCAVLSRLFRIPLVVEVRDLWPELPIAMGFIKHPFLIWATRTLERFAYSTAAHVVALSPGMRDQLRRQGVPEIKLTVIPNCCDDSFGSVTAAQKKAARASIPIPRGRFLALYAGTLGYANGVDYLVRAAKHSLTKKYRTCFVLIGTGAQEQRLRRLAQDLGVLGKNLIMLPAVRKEAIPSLVAAADLNLNVLLDFPELGNSSPNKFFDSLAAGVPVAINFGGWLADTLRETGAGLVLPPGEPDKAADQIAAALAKKTWRDQSGRKAKRLGKDRFSRDVHAARLEELLRSVHEKRRSPLRELKRTG